MEIEHLSSRPSAPFEYSESSTSRDDNYTPGVNENVDNYTRQNVGGEDAINGVDETVSGYNVFEFKCLKNRKNPGRMTPGYSQDQTENEFDSSNLELYPPYKAYYLGMLSKLKIVYDFLVENMSNKIDVLIISPTDIFVSEEEYGKMFKFILTVYLDEINRDKFSFNFENFYRESEFDLEVHNQCLKFVFDVEKSTYFNENQQKISCFTPIGRRQKILSERMRSFKSFLDCSANFQPNQHDQHQYRYRQQDIDTTGLQTSQAVRCDCISLKKLNTCINRLTPILYHSIENGSWVIFGVLNSHGHPMKNRLDLKNMVNWIESHMKVINSDQKMFQSDVEIKDYIAVKHKGIYTHFERNSFGLFLPNLVWIESYQTWVNCINAARISNERLNPFCIHNKCDNNNRSNVKRSRSSENEDEISTGSVNKKLKLGGADTDELDRTDSRGFLSVLSCRATPFKWFPQMSTNMVGSFGSSNSTASENRTVEYALLSLDKVGRCLFLRPSPHISDLKETIMNILELLKDRMQYFEPPVSLRKLATVSDIDLNAGLYPILSHRPDRNFNSTKTTTDRKIEAGGNSRLVDSNVEDVNVVKIEKFGKKILIYFQLDPNVAFTINPLSVKQLSSKVVTSMSVKSTIEITKCKLIISFTVHN